MVSCDGEARNDACVRRGVAPLNASRVLSKQSRISAHPIH